MADKDGGLFFAGLFLGVWLMIMAIVISVMFLVTNHEVGMGQTVCMAIADTPERHVRACLSSEDLLALLRRREGIR